MKTLIFLHGGPGLPDYMKEFFDGKFPTREVIFYSQTQNIVSIDTLFKELDSKIQSSLLNEVYLVGHSWGGILAIEYVRRFRTAISGIVAIDTPYDSSIELDYERRIKELGIQEDDPNRKIFLASIERDAWGERIENLISSTNLKVFNTIYETFLKNFDLKKFIRATKLPILNIFGSEDVRVPAQSIRSYASLSQNLKWVEIQGAGHFPFLLESHRNLTISSIENFISST